MTCFEALKYVRKYAAEKVSANTLEIIDKAIREHTPALSFGDGDFSCATCGMGMKEPCEHWKEFLGDDPKPVIELAEYFERNAIAERAIAEVIAEEEQLKALATSKFYVLQIIGDVEPHLHGPYATEEERDAMARKTRAECDDDLPDGIYAATIQNGQLEVDSYSGAFFAQDKQ